MRLPAVTIAVGHVSGKQRRLHSRLCWVRQRARSCSISPTWHHALPCLIQVHTRIVKSIHATLQQCMCVLLQPTRARVRRLAALMYLRCRMTRRFAAFWLSQTTAALVSSPTIEQQSHSWQLCMLFSSMSCFHAYAGCCAQQRGTAVALCRHLVPAEVSLDSHTFMASARWRAGASTDQGHQQLSDPALEQPQQPALQQLAVKQEPAAVAA
jgi:hypothetical protein